jgi:3-carboxy-cis,cis-muconate cycloisomerase
LPFDALFVPPDLREATGERAWLQAMLDFEVALARAQARAGLVPESLAEEIAASSIEGLVAGGRDAANPVGSLLEALPSGAHRGATSQDVLDTAAALIVRRSLPLIELELASVAATCADLASEHRHTPMAARTFLQQALPTTFGLKAAGWLTAVDEARSLLAEVPLEVELGGAAGTLASLGDNGLRVLSELAEELDLDEPVLPWHTRRLRIGQLGAALALAAGAVEKIALDVKLMAQTEVAELSESSAGGRGGSSTLPHKRNPVGSAVAIACAHGVRGAAFVLISVQAQEHERAGGAWQAEWEALSRALALTGGAAAALREALEGLDVHPDRMLANLEITDGLLMAEAISTALADRLGRSEARALVGEVARRAWEGGRPLRDELIADSRIELSEDELDRALDPAAYLGSADAFIDRALEAHRRRGDGG